MYTPTSGSDSLVTSVSTTLYEQYGLRPLLAFFSHRVIRSGPKLLLYLAVFLSGFVVITKSLSINLPEFSIVASSTRLWRQRPGAHSDSPQAPIGSNTVSPGGLRVVIFGENDVATSSFMSSPDIGFSADNNISWSQVLCTELECASYMSFVPVLAPPQLSLTSNTLHSKAVDRIVEKQAKDDANPTVNASFLSTKYGAHWEAPDLAAQIASFLSLPKPQHSPDETLWVFSFGFWDIWSLSAYPYDIAEGLMSTLAANIFENVETLYTASQESNSIAFSAYNTGGDTRLPWNNSIEPFHILIPLLSDPTLIPGWHLDRPETSALNPKSEQLRNAVRLTKQWNDAIMFQRETWEKKNEKTVSDDSIHADAETTNKAKQPPVNISEKKRRASDSGDVSSDITNEGEKDNAPKASSDQKKAMWRDAIIVRPAEYIMDIVIDGQMHAIGSMDKKGFGAFSAADSFSDVKKPCVLSSQAAPIMNTTEGNDKLLAGSIQTNQVCASPDDHLFFTDFNLGRRAIREVGRISAAVARLDRDTRDKWENAVKSTVAYERQPASWKMFLEQQ